MPGGWPEGGGAAQEPSREAAGGGGRCPPSPPRRARLDRQRVYPLTHQVAERRIDRALAFEPAHPLEPGRDDLDAEMALAAAVVAGMAAMLGAVVADGELRRSERLLQPEGDFGGDRAA